MNLIRIGTDLANASTSAYRHPGGYGAVAMSGTFGGGTYKLEMSPDNGTTWIAVEGVSSTAANAETFHLPTCLVRVTGSGGSGNTVQVWIGRISDEFGPLPP